jgi:ribosomal protein S27E
MPRLISEIIREPTKVADVDGEYGPGLVLTCPVCRHSAFIVFRLEHHPAHHFQCASCATAFFNDQGTRQ